MRRLRRVVYIASKRFSLKPQLALGTGGEADVYHYDQGRALKVWKTPDHPDFDGRPAEQAATRRRLDLLQSKLREFPATATLPPQLITPQELAFDDTRARRIAGFTMPLVRDAYELARLSERSFRTAGLSADEVRTILLDLAETVAALHTAGLVIGDFNDLNVLISGGRAWLIDADSFQFGRFPCVVYSERFLDPLLCLGKGGRLTLDRPYEPSSDWYAFLVMLMRSFLFVGPYGGVYRPKSAPQLSEATRPLQRITVFHPDVRYPKPAAPLEALSDDLLHHLQATFVDDRRSPFPRSLLTGLRFERCPSCGLEHCRASCPRCTKVHAIAARPPAIVRTSLQVTRLFETQGVIIAAAIRQGRVCWLAHEQGAFRREGGAVLLRGELHPELTAGLLAEETILARRGLLVRIDRSGTVRERAAVDTRSGRAIFTVTDAGCCWVDGGQLLRDGPHGPELVGEVLAGRTRLWAGPSFGFGFYRAGGLNVSFLFPTRGRGLDDRLQLPPLRGRLRSVACSLSSERCWFFSALELGGQTTLRCLVLDRQGSILAARETLAADLAWLDPERGHCAIGSALFQATDHGVIRLEIKAGTIAVTHEFPETEPFVDSGSSLFPHRDGLVVVNQRSIDLLQLG